MVYRSLLKYALSEYNPLVIYKRLCMRRALTNHTPTLLCPNCLGGILFHDLRLQFRSPTVNTMMLQTDFAKFVLNFDYYLEQQLHFFKHPDYDCPCAYLDDITVHFTHYENEQMAEEKWEERKLRIDRENLFICLMERDGIDKHTIEKLGSIKTRGIVIFTATEYPDIPYTLYLPKYSGEAEVGNILSYSYITGKREYERYFDFVKWFNEAGNDSVYNIKPYVRKV